MLPDISKIKGIHPGIILKREIKRRGLKNKELASLINEHAQTISSILKGKRSINPKLSVELGKLFEVDSDYFMILQASSDVKKALQQYDMQRTPDLKTIRRVLFWDMDLNKIDWIKNRRAVIKRIFERGNDAEIQEILNFYGLDIVKEECNSIGRGTLPSFEMNVKKYLESV